MAFHLTGPAATLDATTPRGGGSGDQCAHVRLLRLVADGKSPYAVLVAWDEP